MRISGCRVKEKTQDRLAEFFVGSERGGFGASIAKRPPIFIGSISSSLGNWRIACR
jgi:hypothetical protein